MNEILANQIEVPAWCLNQWMPLTDQLMEPLEA